MATMMSRAALAQWAYNYDLEAFSRALSGD